MIQKTILLVEDDANISEEICTALQSLSYNVIEARDGLEALQLEGASRPDLIILDRMLPKLSGMDVLMQIRKKSQCPILMLTAMDQVDQRVEGLKAGADDYLCKPFSMVELTARMDALLRRREQSNGSGLPSAGILQYLSIQLDLDDYRATLSGRELKLSPKEFQLLSLFIGHPGRTFNRSYLLDRLWNNNLEAGDRAVDNAILRLRKKLGKLEDHIESVWAMGYRLRKLDQ